MPLAANGDAPAVLALHGLGGAPAEMRLVTDAAGDLGLKASAPCLPGHGGGLERLAGIRWQDWRDAAAAELRQLAQETARPVIVAGLSMGSLLAAHLAAEHAKSVAGLVLLAAPLRLPRPHPAGTLALMARGGVPNFSVAKSRFDVERPEGQRERLGHDSFTAHSAVELWRCGRALQPKLRQIGCPILIMHGMKDRTASHRNAWVISSGVMSSDQRIVFFGRSGHLLTLDYDQRLVRREIERFCSRLAGAAGDACAHETPVEP